MDNKMLYNCQNCGIYECDSEKMKCPTCDCDVIHVKICPNQIWDKINVPGMGLVNCLTSIESLQDMHSYANQLECSPSAFEGVRSVKITDEEIEEWKNLVAAPPFGKIRTTDITNEEIEDWKYYHELFQKLKFDEAKKKYKVCFIKE